MTMKKLNTVVASIITLTIISSAHAADFQQNVLLNPSSHQLEAESNGRVMIYDQMDNETVELALNTQFDRIENMMFVRTQYIQKDGSIEEDDDCE